MIPPDYKLHAIAVHFPTALLLVAFLMELGALAFARQRAWLAPAAALLLVLGAAGAIGAKITGEEAEHSAYRTSEAMEEVMEEHEDFGKLTVTLFVVLALVRVGSLAVASREEAKLPAPVRWTRGRELPLRLLYLLAFAGAVGVLLQTGQLGGQLVYDHGANVQPYEALMKASDGSTGNKGREKD